MRRAHRADRCRTWCGSASRTSSGRRERRMAPRPPPGAIVTQASRMSSSSPGRSSSGVQSASRSKRYQRFPLSLAVASPSKTTGSGCSQSSPVLRPLNRSVAEVMSEWYDGDPPAQPEPATRRRQPRDVDVADRLHLLVDGEPQMPRAGRVRGQPMVVIGAHGGDGDPGPPEAADPQPVEAVPAGGGLADHRERDLGLGLEPPDLLDRHRRIDVQLQEVAVGSGEADGRGEVQAGTGRNRVARSARAARARPRRRPASAYPQIASQRTSARKVRSSRIRPSSGVTSSSRPRVRLVRLLAAPGASRCR